MTLDRLLILANASNQYSELIRLRATCSFLDGTSSTYLEELEERYRADPSSVDKTWASFFNSLGMGRLALLCLIVQHTKLTTVLSCHPVA